MKRYRVSWRTWHVVDVEAKDADRAIDKALDLASEDDVQRKTFDPVLLLGGGCYACHPERYGSDEGLCEDCAEDKKHANEDYIYEREKDRRIGL